MDLIARLITNVQSGVRIENNETVIEAISTLVEFCSGPNFQNIRILIENAEFIEFLKNTIQMRPLVLEPQSDPRFDHALNISNQKLLKQYFNLLLVLVKGDAENQLSQQIDLQHLIQVLQFAYQNLILKKLNLILHNQICEAGCAAGVCKCQVLT